MEDAYELQYFELSKPNISIKKKFWNLFSNTPESMIMSENTYIAMSLANLRHIRDRNFMYWIARKAKLGHEVNKAVAAIEERNLTSRYLAIKNLLD